MKSFRNVIIKTSAKRVVRRCSIDFERDENQSRLVQARVGIIVIITMSVIDHRTGTYQGIAAPDRWRERERERRRK